MSKYDLLNPGSIEFPNSNIIPLNGIELEVIEAGIENKGNPIVLCHGFPEIAYSWRYQIPALIKAGYHVIAPNQRGYGKSTQPKAIKSYDILNLTNDLIALLDHFGYKKSIFIGHDWGANVIWNLALLHPNRVSKVINLALPYQERGLKPWTEFMEEIFGPDFYFVHLNRQPGVADAVLNTHTKRFLNNIFRKNLLPNPPEPGMLLINLALTEQASGEPFLSNEELAVYEEAFLSSGFTAALNWYRNLDRNWNSMADIKPRINHPTLMIYGAKDSIPPSVNLDDFAPNLTVKTLDCGHWIQQEKPKETNSIILEWLNSI